MEMMVNIKIKKRGVYYLKLKRSKLKTNRQYDGNKDIKNI